MPDEKPISMKEVFERLVQLETKFELSVTENRTTSKKFQMLAILIISLELLNFMVHAMYLLR